MGDPFEGMTEDMVEDMDMSFKMKLVLLKHADNEGWNDLFKRVPAIRLPRGCSLKVTPPINMAAARFRVCLRHAGQDHEISVYLDSKHNHLGCFGPLDAPQPYWEVYPVNGDVGRCGVDDGAELERLLNRAVNEIRRPRLAALLAKFRKWKDK